MKEWIKTFDADGSYIGNRSRDEAHQRGLWHETFHCWFLSFDHGVPYIYFQLRSETKADFPGLLDITAAGHLFAEEKVEDGVREIEEELGVSVPFSDLKPCGVVKNEIIEKDFIDREFSHTFVYEHPHTFDSFHVDEAEVIGIFRATYDSFSSVCRGKSDSMPIEGFQLDDGGKKFVQKEAGLQDFVPHQHTYLEEVVDRIAQIFVIR
ncbi:NUDIX hydrolase [Thalassobacillus hwangdonensis]|uniref:NUDIX domain-containing protein n=1 Tax=Thalassobacillus hwangdonensis TaxID=546108 RepID=A0ABW3KZB8_9BACI